MRIDEMVLIGYKPLLLNGIKEFRITFESVYQLLIGTNGSGKSSVVKELSPIPAYSGKYVRGGSKTIKFPHRGKYYILVSDFALGGSGKHSFLCDGDEQNPGGTYTVQKQLVQEHFGLTDELHSILTDKLRFTRMPPQKRREWIIRLSGGDLGYAMQIFQDLKSKARDMVGVIKHLNARLSQETEKLPTAEKLEEQMLLSNVLKNELTWMMESKDMGVQEAELTITHRISKNLVEIRNLSAEIVKTDIYQPGFLSLVTVNEITDLIPLTASLKAESNANDELYRRYSDEHHKLSDIIEALVKSNADSVDGLKTKIDELEKKRLHLKSKIGEWDLSESDPTALIATTEAIGPDYVELFSALPDNKSEEFSQANAIQKKQAWEESRVECEKLQNYVAKLEHRLEHIENAKKDSCPKCGYQWIPGLKDGEQTMFQNLLTESKRRLVLANEKQEQLRTYLDDFSAYVDLLRRSKRMIESNPSLKALWGTIHQRQLLITTPKAALPLFTRWRQDLNTALEIWHLETELFTYQEAYKQASELENSSHFNDRIQSIDAELQECINRKQTLQRKIQVLGEYRQAINIVSNKYDRIQELTKATLNDLTLITKTIRNDLLDKCIREHQGLLAQTEQSLITAKALTDIINDLTINCEQAKEDGKIFQVLADELSPTNGLIADLLKESIFTLIDQMNSVISSVWTYNMKILPCGMDGEDLDYKFPVVIKDHDDDPVSDVSETSTSQISIIDFSFKLIVMLYLSLEDFPLYLDELASDMDDQHRVNAMNFLKTLVESHRCSQLFLISHYLSLYGTFTSAQICVMDDTNLNQIPNQVNHHVFMG